MRTTHLTTSFTGVIATGAYENEKPLFSITEITDNDERTDEQKSERLKELQSICFNKFQERERESIIKRIEKERADFRFYDINGKKYPSVTSIIGWDANFYCSPDELVQYAAQGEINHLKLEYFIKTGKWIKAEDIPEAYKFIVTLKKGSLHLDIDSGNIQGFLEKYPIEFTESEKQVYNEKHLYAGRLDAIGIPKENKKDGIDEVNTLFDLKRSTDAVKNFKQLSAYAKCLDGIEQLIVIPVNDKTKQGFSKPLVTKDIDAYFKMFLQDRDTFKERYGI